MWFYNRDRPDRPTSHVVHQALHLSGPLDLPALRQAVADLAARHDVLRVRLDRIGRAPMQVFDGRLAVPVRVVDIEARSESDIDAAVRAAGDRPFDLGLGPLLRVEVLRLGVGEHVLVAAMSHVIWDGLSHLAFQQDLATAYAARVTGRAPRWPAPAPAYREFTTTRLGPAARTAEEIHLDYWAGRLAGVARTLDLPTRAPRSAVYRVDTGTHGFRLGAGLSADVVAMARAEGVTLFSVLAAAQAMVLGELAGQSDVVFGSVISGRHHPGMGPALGMYADMIYLRVSLSGDPTYRELIGQVLRRTMEALKHHDVSYERLLDRLLPDRDRTQPWHPMCLFHSWFSLSDIADPQPPRMAGLRVRKTWSGATDPSCELPEGGVHPLHQRQNPRLELRMTDAGLDGVITYNRHLFDAAFVADLADRLGALLLRVCADPGKRVSELTAQAGAPPAVT